MSNWLTLYRKRILQTLSMTVLLVIIGVIVTAFVRGVRKPAPKLPPPPAPSLGAQVISVTEGYDYVVTAEGKPSYRVKAARDTAYSDGRHELEQLTLIAYATDGKEKAQIVADHGVYRQQEGEAQFTGHVKMTDAEGLEVTSEKLNYNQIKQVAATDVAVQFKRGEMSGSSIGAVFYAQTKVIDLSKDAHLVKEHVEKGKGGPPVEVRGGWGGYDGVKGLIRFEGAVVVSQGTQEGRADAMNGFLDAATKKKLERIELRGNSFLKDGRKGNQAEAQARDMDFFFDGEQQLTKAVAVGAATARSLEPDAPRELSAERVEALYAPSPQGSNLQSTSTQGRTVLKMVEMNAKQPAKSAERVLEADAVQTTFSADGRFLQRAEANGNAWLTITPLLVTPKSERQKLHAAKFNVDYFETGNAIKTFVADGNAVAEFEPLQVAPEVSKDAAKSKDKANPVKQGNRTLNGQKLTANLQQQTQEITDLTAEGEVKYTDGDRNATAARGVYEAATQTVAMRGKPLLWDATARTNADEIDANLDTGESQARGHVRTTYYSRETTGGAAPFKKSKAPVTIAADRAVVRHREGAARYLGNARAWQDDDFVRGDNMELDKGERAMHAWGNVQSAFYGMEREIEKGKKEIVPVFVSAEKLDYADESRTAHYEGKVKIRQGSDQIDAAVADALMDQENKLSKMTATREVVLTQPQRRGQGDLLVYTAADDAAVLTGNLAQVEDREREVTTKGARLTLHLRDARIEADDVSGTKRVKTTHRIQR
ncbi:MAG: LPS export ABC transporter periplasmic protein LptC [Acidobacteria bacterium]|nr:LPS export ABC transporter periplasmic protein LptC [Acidobacteriota bacterium]MBI3426830.1 LPS export ABC transporter periplasmic protein LptC [Acidobacteriota bacterium]